MILNVNNAQIHQQMPKFSYYFLQGFFTFAKILTSKIMIYKH